jgi:hypothetical protein
LSERPSPLQNASQTAQKITKVVQWIDFSDLLQEQQTLAALLVLTNTILVTLAEQSLLHPSGHSNSEYGFRWIPIQICQACPGGNTPDQAWLGRRCLLDLQASFGFQGFQDVEVDWN